MIELDAVALAILATYRLAQLVALDDGLMDVCLRLRAATQKYTMLLDCPFCIGVWIALPFALMLGHSVTETLLLWLVIAGGQSALESMRQ